MSRRASRETHSIVELQPHDDLASVRHRLGWLGGGRVVLALPWGVRFLSRELDFDLLRREAARWRLEIAIVSPDAERRLLARECGFPAFADVAAAQETSAWHIRTGEEAAPPPKHWWEEEVDLRPRGATLHPLWSGWPRLVTRVGMFLLALSIVAVTAYVVVPSGAVTLVPAGRVFVTIVPVSVDLEAEGVDMATGVVPARRVGDEFEGYAEVETTGKMRVVAGRAKGTVVFTNLLAQEYLVPAGTVVRTSSTSYPIRFRTTEELSVPPAGQASISIEAMEDGVGNVAAFQINQVEGVVAYAVRVINPEATTGAEPREVRVVSQEDYDRLRTDLMRQLLDQAYGDLTDYYLEPTEVLLRQSLRIEAVPKQTYTRFVTEQADTVGLSLRLLVRGWVVDVDNAETLAYAALSQRIPPGYRLVNAQFEIGEVAEEDVGAGPFTFFVTSHGYADPALDPGDVAVVIRGRRMADARERLLAQYPLAEEPRIVLWPEWPRGLKWLERVPLVPLRISVRVVSQAEAMGQAF